jgi:hypothetical protein
MKQMDQQVFPGSEVDLRVVAPNNGDLYAYSSRWEGETVFMR